MLDRFPAVDKIDMPGGDAMSHSNDHCYPVLSAEQMRLADEKTIQFDQISASQLMERAGKAIAEAVIRCARDGGRIVVVTGAGNNGGDGFVAARLLRNRRIPVTAISLVPIESLKGEVAEQAERARQAGVKVRPATGKEDLLYMHDWLGRAAMVVDAIFGTGLARPVDGWMAEAVDCINNSDRYVLSVDIPSGIDSDSGEVLGTAIHADFTLPIAAYKWGHWLGQGRTYAGKLLSPAPIGISEGTLERVMAERPFVASAGFLVNREIIKHAFPERPVSAHKNQLGHLWVFGGSRGYTGAPRLAACGGQAIGTGLVSIACPESVWPVVAASSLEVMVHSQDEAPWHSASAMVAGPGWGRVQAAILGKLMQSGQPLVLDADALNMVAEDAVLAKLLTGRAGITVLTPHPGEAARLLEMTSAEVQKSRLASALKLVDKFNCWVVLKGEQTLVVSPERCVWISPFGSPNLAVAGTGDVLSGMIGGLLAAGRDASVAIPAAVGLHAMAGEQKGWHRAGQLEDIVADLVGALRSWTVE
jgi:NAD(P)H-hydrate epimerase